MTRQEDFIERQLQHIERSEVYSDLEKRALRKLFPIFYRHLLRDTSDAISPDKFNEIADGYVNILAFLMCTVHHMLTGTLPREVRASTLAAMFTNFQNEIVRLVDWNAQIENMTPANDKPI